MFLKPFSVLVENNRPESEDILIGVSLGNSLKTLPSFIIASLNPLCPNEPTR